jgi:Amino acid permease
MRCTSTTDDSAAHVSEEVAGAARAAPIAIMVGVGATQLLGWLIYISASFATTSVPDLISTTLPLPMGQLFFNVLGKRGMLAIWSCIIVVQVRNFSSASLRPAYDRMLNSCSSSLAQHKA